MDSFKITVVGDKNVGKTSMLLAYKNIGLRNSYESTVFENYSHIISVKNKKYTVRLWDTAGQETYSTLRALSYPGTDCFIVCYAIQCRASYDNVASVWVPEIREHAPNVPFVLVATNLDIRVNNNTPGLVTTAEGVKMKRKIGAEAFFECSTLMSETLPPVFKGAVKCFVTSRTCVMF